MLKPISTRTHGYLDLAGAAALAALPHALGASREATRMLTGAALGMVGLSLLTRYEMGLVRVVPMRAHLAMDGMLGVMLCSAPFLLPDDRADLAAACVLMGVSEVAGAVLTEPESPVEEAEAVSGDGRVVDSREAAIRLRQGLARSGGFGRG